MSAKRKSIAYAYPTSTIGGESGGFFVKQETMHTSNTGCRGYETTHSSDPYPTYTDPDLIALYHGTEGEPCPLARKYHPEWQPE